MDGFPDFMILDDKIIVEEDLPSEQIQELRKQ